MNFISRVLAWALPPQPDFQDIYVGEKKVTGVEAYLNKLEENDSD